MSIAARCLLLVVLLSGLIGALRCQGSDALGSWATGYPHPSNGYVYQHPNVPGNISWPSTFNAINMAVIPNPSRLSNPLLAQQAVLVFDSNSYSQTNSPGPNQVWQQRYSIGDPENPPSFVNEVLTIQQATSRIGLEYLGDLFCSGHTWLPDGRLFIAGGNTQYWTTSIPFFKGSRFAAIWDPSTWSTPSRGWTMLPLLNHPRWYPTVTLTGDNKVIVAGGSSDTALSFPNDPAINTYEVYDVTAGQWEGQQQGAVFVPHAYSGPSVARSDFIKRPCTFSRVVASVRHDSDHR